VTTHDPHLPYFDRLLEKIHQGDPVSLTAFPRHVHYGYWDNPSCADGSLADYAAAAERMTEVMASAAGLRDGMRVLDVGCGFGGTIASLDEGFGEMRLHGLNIDLRQIRRAQTELQPHGSNALTFTQGDAMFLPFADGTFDAVLAVECSFHFPSRARFLEEARRVLRPGGRLTISDFLPVPAMAWAWRTAGRPIGLALGPMLGRMDLSYSLGTYHRAALDAGLALAEARDITPAILPSIPLWRRLMRHLMPGYPGLAELFGAFAWYHRVGLIRYTILTFDAVPAGRAVTQPLSAAVGS
jgi:SAM-dependent methyltransferase